MVMSEPPDWDDQDEQGDRGGPDQPPTTPTDGGGGGGDSPLVLERTEEIRAHCERLAEQARREILILSRDLEPAYYDQRPFLAAVQRLALEVPWMPVRVLLFEPSIPVARGHRFIALSRRLTSRIAIRRLAEDLRDRPDAFLIADGRGYCLRPLAGQRTAVVDHHGPQQARRLRAEFQQMWEQSDGDSALRQLHL